MPILTLLRGSNDLTRAQKAYEILKDRPSAVRVSKTAIDTMMFGNLVNKNHKISICICVDILRNLMLTGMDIIIDDPNLNEKHVEYYHNLAKKNGYEFVTIGSVEEREICVFTLDGGIYDVSDRTDYSLVEGVIDQEVWNDPHIFNLDDPRENVIDMIARDWEMGYEIVIIADRYECTKQATEEQLHKHTIPYHRVIYRPNGDTRTLVDYKKGLLNNYLQKDLISFIYDHDLDSMKLWLDFKFHVVDIQDKEIEIENEYAIGV